ncbi:FIG00440260: hypothetical protein [hydrothermal vent metagenome]|uniref:Peptidoglycan binding-like domain-containing protein n=1 Tax=hydrothermal vent metagenome TaxID=652676 RepID=A0A3B0S3I3_9ZZZZ
MRRLAISFVFICAVLALLPGRATAAGQEICNQTSFVIYSAIAFPDQAALVTEGWTRLRPGECRSVLPAPVPEGEYFVFGRSSAAHRGGIRQWSGPTPLCVDVTDFSVAGPANCENLGLETRMFHIIDGNPPEGRQTVFTETGEYGERAGLAGLQRLLTDNGLNVRVIDGYSGRRTNIAIAKYLKQQKIKTRPADADLIDLLESSARTIVRSTGLEVCNQADAPIWTAYARRTGKQWESRGWWSLAQGACLQLVSDRLRKRDKFFVYAGLVQPDGETGLLAAKESFCVSEIKFSVFGRHDCETRGYRTVNFSKVKLAKGPITRLTFMPEDFGGTTITMSARP